MSVEVIGATEVVEAVEVIEAAEQGNHPVIKVQAAVDFLRPKRLLRSLRLVMLSCLLRSWRPLKFSESLVVLKSIMQRQELSYFDVLKKIKI